MKTGRWPRTDSQRVLSLLVVAAVAMLAPTVAGAGPGHEVTLVGAVESLPATADLVGDWTVAGKVVHVTAATAIDQTKGAPAPGAVVQVKGGARADGSIDARAIACPMIFKP